MRRVNNFSAFLFIVLTLLAFSSPIGAEEAPEQVIRTALVGFENMDNEPDHDYLGSLISAVIREDLGAVEGLTLVERVRMNRIIEEQQLQISGLFEEKNAAEAGKLLGTDYLAGGSFIVIDGEVLLDITLIHVETAELLTFSSRGSTEDAIHIAAEKIVRELTGERIIFRTADSDRAILKQTMLPPGTLRLFSPLIDARIYIDDVFYGYTKGDGVTPIEIELQPGKHRVKTDLGNSFGVVAEPEILFQKWQEEFTVESGKAVVLEDKTQHYNSILYDLKKLVHESESIHESEEQDHSDEHQFSFIDRAGNSVDGSLTVYFSRDEKGGMSARLLLVYNYERKIFELDCEPGDSLEFEDSTGVVDLKAGLDSRYTNSSSASWSLWRNDISQNMFRN